LCLSALASDGQWHVRSLNDTLIAYALDALSVNYHLAEPEDVTVVSACAV